MGGCKSKPVPSRYAADYISRGLACIPVPAGKKKPDLTGWQKLRLTKEDVPRYFGDDETNVGISLGTPSGDAVDVDLDVPEAEAIAEQFLPPTVTSGRGMRPRTHRWYRSPGSETKKWKGIEGEMLLELRSTGCQTLVEPSVHPDGDRYMWDRTSGFQMASLEAEQLRGMCRELATATLVARHLPPIGGRHDYALTLAGYLLRPSRLDEETALKILLAGWHAADGDSTEAVKDLEGIVRDTARKLEARERAVGGPTLDGIVPGMAGKLADWWGWRKEGQENPSGWTAARKDVPWPELSDAAYCGLAGETVRFIEPETEADPVALLFNLMAAFGNAIGRGAYFRVGADTHYPKLFGALVGETAKGRKGMSWNPVKMLMEQADRRWSEHGIANGLSSGEGLIYKLQQIRENDALKALADGSLTEELSEESNIVAGSSRVPRLLVMEPELANVLKVIKREGNTLSPVIREAWDNGALQTLTRNSPMKISDSHVSMIGHITKGELTRYLTETEMANGLANRFLYLLVRRSKELAFGGNLREENMAPRADRLTEAMSFGRTAGEIVWSNGAREIWKDVYGDLSEGKPGLFGAVTSRAEAQVVRIAMLYAVMDLSKDIQPEHLEAALAMWRYSEQSASYIFGNSTGDSVADRIHAALREAGSVGMTRMQIRDLFQRNKSAETIEKALSLLRDLKRARVEVGSTGGRPEERWFSTQ